MFEVVEDIVANTVEKGEIKLSQLSQVELQQLYNDAHFKRYLKKATVKKSSETTSQESN